jgi:hypothetical protein
LPKLTFTKSGKFVILDKDKAVIKEFARSQVPNLLGNARCEVSECVIRTVSLNTPLNGKDADGDFTADF